MSIRKDIKDEYLYSVKDSEIHGKGVFAKENIEKGKKSLACILTDEEFLYSDLGKYINHSKSPNCKLVDDGSRNFLVVAINDINEGDEILVDYDNNPPEFQNSNNLGKDYFGLLNMEEIEDDRIKYRYFWKLDEDIKRIKQLLV